VFVPYHMTNVPVAFRGPGMFHVTITDVSNERYGDCGGTYRTETTYDDPNPWVPDAPANAIMFSCNT